MANFANPQSDTNVLRMILASGTAALPSIVFANDLTKGLYWTIDGLTLSGLATPVNDGDAANKAYVDSAAGGSFPLLAPDGTDSAPSYSFASNPTAGFWFDLAHNTVSVDGQNPLAVPSGALVLGPSDQSSCYVIQGLADTLTFTNVGVTGPVVLVLDNNETANETSMLLWDITAMTLQRVSIGTADSGGTGFRLLRIPN